MAQAPGRKYISCAMQDNNNNKLNTTFFQLLRPIARLFLRFGRGYRE